MTEDRPEIEDRSPDEAPRDGASEDERARSENDPKRLGPGAEWVSQQRVVARYAGVGMTFGFTIVASALLGAWLDSTWGTQPWLLLLGVFGGFALGTVYLLQRTSRPD